MITFVGLKAEAKVLSYFLMSFTLRVATVMPLTYIFS